MQNFNKFTKTIFFLIALFAFTGIGGDALAGGTIVNLEDETETEHGETDQSCEDWLNDMGIEYSGIGVGGCDKKNIDNNNRCVYTNSEKHVERDADKSAGENFYPIVRNKFGRCTKIVQNEEENEEEYNPGNWGECDENDESACEEGEKCYCSDTKAGICAPEGSVVICPPLSHKTFASLLDSIINFIFNFAIVMAPLMFIVAGFYFMASAGDPTKIKQAKDIAIYTAIGLAIVMLAKGIIEVIQNIFSG